MLFMLVQGELHTVDFLLGHTGVCQTSSGYYTQIFYLFLSRSSIFLRTVCECNISLSPHTTFSQPSSQSNLACQYTAKLEHFWQRRVGASVRILKFDAQQYDHYKREGERESIFFSQKLFYYSF